MRVRTTIAFIACAAHLACGDDGPASPAIDSPLVLELTELPALDPAREGRYALWLEGAGGDAVLAGEPQPAGAGTLALRFRSPVDRPSRALLTIEPPGDDDGQPSRYVVLHGDFHGSGAELGIEGAITDGRPLNPEPGGHSLFTSSNNPRDGYPSLEDAGLWLFNIAPSTNPHRTREVKLTPLRPSWMYEGWIVRDIDSPAAIWIAYGKYRPDEFGLLSSRDHSGSGPFSGDVDYVNGGIEDVPGDEWTTNLFDLELPGGLTVPLDLDEVRPDGTPVWHHVITAEPAFEELEPLLSERPLLPLYRNSIGAGGPGEPRFIQPLATIAAGRIRADTGGS